jgi:hypothetical protein
VHGYPVRLQLFTVPGQVYFNATRKLVLTGADGVVFVADSQRERQDANLESLQNLEANLEEQDRKLSDIPHVLQFNKRDLGNVLPVEDLHAHLNAYRAPGFESAASKGVGVLEPLDELVRLVLLDLEKRQIFRTDADKQPAPPRFEAAADGIGASLSRASEELWRDGMDHTLQALKTLPPPHRSAPPATQQQQPPPQRSAPPRVAMSGMPTRIPASTGRRQTSEPARVPSFQARTAEAPAPSSGGMSWVSAFPEDQAPQVAELEHDFVRGDFRSAMMRCDALAAEVLADAAQESGLDNEERRPAIVAMCLGLPGERWRMFRALVHEARLGAEVSEVQALDVYGVVIELNRLRLRTGTPRER